MRSSVPCVVRNGLLAVLALVSIGCQAGPPIFAQTGSRAPREGTAIIQNGDWAVVDMINARFFEDQHENQSYVIQAGTCDLGVVYGSRDGSTIKLLTFDAKPGHTYTFKTRTAIIITTFQGNSYHDDQWDVKLIDKADGSVVAETHGMK